MRMKIFLALLAAALVAGCRAPAPEATADAIYSGGDIITMNDAQPSAEALAVKDGRILAVGSRAALERAHQGPSTQAVDLAGQALLPGFLDPHSHYINSLTAANQANVSPPPVGPGQDIPAIIAELKKLRDARKIPEGGLVMAYGYDDTFMPGGRALTRDDLDKDFPDHPVMVGLVSMHGAVLNSAALRKFGITARTKAPEGGVIARRQGSNEPAGLVMETAYFPLLGALPQPTPEQEVEWSRAGQRLYAAAGITTAQEGVTHPASLALMWRAAAADANIIDIVAFPFVMELDAVLKDNPASSFGRYQDHLKLGGVKMVLDGSPQGKTALFTTPYLTGGPNGEKDWRGKPLFPEDAVKAMVKRVYDLGLPLNVHANGDAAIDLFLRAHEYAAKGSLDKDRRTTVIHSQFVRRDQLEKFAAYKLIPSFYTEHAFYFSGAHLQQRGQEQTFFLSPMKTAIAKGLRPTNHTDFNVLPLDQMFVVWTAVNRVSRAGEAIGPDERVTPMEALKAITINAAYQYGEEKTKGSLEPGKLADLVILDRSPLKVPPMEIKDIRVAQTIKDGKTIYPAP